THAAGPYNYQNIEIEGIAVYTNNPPAGAFRGFGVTQSAFANECNINKLADMVGLSPWEFRYRNAIRPGQVLPNGQIADEGTALVETLEAVKDAYENNDHVGIACAFKNAGLGVGIPDTGRCRIV
ncbi:molybdopterin cofactor-binding domain-containing protein, partial [Clostridium perfringens]